MLSNLGISSLYKDFYVYKILLSDNAGGVLVENVEKQLCEWIPLLKELNILVFERVRRCCQHFQFEVRILYIFNLN